MQVINSDIKQAQDHIILLEKLSVAHYGHGIHWIFPEIKTISISIIKDCLSHW